LRTEKSYPSTRILGDQSTFTDCIKPQAAHYGERGLEIPTKSHGAASFWMTPGQLQRSTSTTLLFGRRKTTPKIREEAFETMKCWMVPPEHGLAKHKHCTGIGARIMTHRAPSVAGKEDSYNAEVNCVFPQQKGSGVAQQGKVPLQSRDCRSLPATDL